jgi:hypothetical protein
MYFLETFAPSWLSENRSVTGRDEVSMMLAAFRLSVDHDRQFAIAHDVRQSAQGGIGTIPSDQLLSEQRSAATRYGKHWSYPLSRAWIISARRMLSAIFA